MRRLILLFWLLPGLASAHGDPIPGEPLAWSVEPWMAAPLLISALLFGIGFVRLRSRSGAGRGRLDAQAWRFAGGFVVLCGAVLSPLHQAGGRSFTAHMIEHELMMLAAAPLLVWARPLGVMIWAFPAAARQEFGQISRGPASRGLWSLFTDPLVSTALQAAALWLWHLPWLFDRALASEGWHAGQHLSFFVTALLFWTSMLGPRRNVWIAAACLFATSMISGALGAFMALSQSPWYDRYSALGMTPYGLSPAQDQQLAGVLMWVPGGLIHALAALVLLTPKLRSLQEIADA